MGIPTGIASIYTFDHANLWGNFSYRIVQDFFDFKPASVINLPLPPISVLTQIRPLNEFLLNLYSAFNVTTFFASVDTTPMIDGQSLSNNPDALMYKIWRQVNHYGYRTSNIRAGWIEWRDVPYRGQNRPGITMPICSIKWRLIFTSIAE